VKDAWHDGLQGEVTDCTDTVNAVICQGMFEPAVVFLRCHRLGNSRCTLGNSTVYRACFSSVLFFFHFFILGRESVHKVGCQGDWEVLVLDAGDRWGLILLSLGVVIKIRMATTDASLTHLTPRYPIGAGK
jgi:hypothetical protein